VLQEVGEVKNCVAACNKEGLMKHLEKQQKELEICEKALAEYMESKRRAFPRFYFVSSADLLDILSNGNNPIKVMQHMNKCFQVGNLVTPDLFVTWLGFALLTNDFPAESAALELSRQHECAISVVFLL